MRERGGRLVLMDFGGGRETVVTAVSDRAGTPVYQAPDLLAGGTATAQSDIYNLGVLLFFLLTGQYPVTGASIRELREAHAAGRTRMLRDLRPDVPDRLRQVVSKALSPRPAHRYSSAGAMESALIDALGTARATPRSWPPARRLAAMACLAAAVVAGAFTWARWWPTRPQFDAVAVLPLGDLSSTPETDYFADGLTEQLIDDLARLAPLRVISRTSSMYYKSVKKPLPEIARDLGVPAVLEGTVRRDEGRISVELRLIEAASDRAMWSVRHHAANGELHALEQAIVRDVAGRLGYASRPGESRVVANEAYASFLKGRSQLAKRTPEGLGAARDFFQRAIEADPQFAQAHAGLGEAYLLLGAFGVLPKSEVYPRARSAADNALRLDSLSPEAHAIIGYLLYEAGEHDDGWRELLRALELDPSYSTARQWYALSLVSNGKGDEAVRQRTVSSRWPCSRLVATRRPRRPCVARSISARRSPRTSPRWDMTSPWPVVRRRRWS